MDRDLIDCQEDIARALMRSVNEDWEEIAIKADLNGDSINVELRYQPKGESTFSRSTAPVDEIGEYMFELAELVSTREKGLFKSCIFSVDSSGRYNAEFVY